MPPPGTTLRNIRMDDALWELADRAAKADRTNRSDFIRLAIAERADRVLKDADDPA